MRKKLLAGMTVLILLAALVGGATMALFTDTAANAGNTFTAGTVDIGVGEEPAVPVHVDNMAPGDTYNGSFTVVNDGSLELRFGVSYETDGVLFGGPTPAVVGGLEDDQGVVLAPGDSAEVAFTVDLPLDADNDYQGATGTVNFTIAAEQTANNPIEPLNVLVNGGFETGDLTGWNVNVPGLAGVVTTFGYPVPTHYSVEGDSFLVLTAGAANVYTVASQTVTLNAGETLSGWAAFVAWDDMPWNDDAAVVIVSGGPLATPWAQSVAVVGGYGQSSPWESWSWTAPADGVYTLELKVRNVGDAMFSSVALFDANVIQ